MDYVQCYPLYSEMTSPISSILVIFQASNSYSRGIALRHPITDHRRLQVDVAERTRDSAHDIPHSNSLATSITNINERIESSVR